MKSFIAKILSLSFAGGKPVGIGSTGYNDRVRPEDFPAGSAIMTGQDSSGRPYVAFRFIRSDEPDEVQALCLHKRYSNKEQPWVVAGHYGCIANLTGPLPEGDGSAFALLPEEKDWPSWGNYFNSAVGPEGMAALLQLFEGGQMTLWSSECPMSNPLGWKKVTVKLAPKC